MTDLTALKEAARAATPGPWIVRALENFGWNVVRYRNGDKFDVERVAKAPGEADATYISFAHPAAILSLIEEVERLRERLQAVVDWADYALANPAEFDSHGVRKVEEAAELLAILSKIMPIRTHNTQDYAELTFGDHQTQAMTTDPDTWNRLADAYQALTTLTNEGAQG